MSFVIDRRRFLQALGLGALAAGVGRAGSASAGPTEPTRRLVIFVTAHGHVWNGWHTPLPGLPTDRTVERDLQPLLREELSETLRPFHAIRDRVLPIEGLAHTTTLAEFALEPESADLNNHNLAYAHLLTGQTAAQRGAGETCIGGGISIDQEIGRRTGGPGRFDACVWGADHFRPYSFIEAGREAPRVEDPERIYADLLGLYVPPVGPAPTRADRIASARPSVLDGAAREFELVLPRLGREGRLKLEQHRDLLRDLERSLALAASPSCDPTFVATGTQVEQYLALATLALSCDLTRVITVVLPVLRPDEFGYPASEDVHGSYAHSAVEGGSDAFSPVSERAMIDYNVWYARHIAGFIEHLDTIPDGGGSMLDQTRVVWLSELGSPTHEHTDACTLLAGGSDFFRLGRYVRYARDIRTPFPWEGRGEFTIGPSTSQLLVTILRSMGFDDDHFGLTEVTRVDGSTIDLRGTLPALHV